MFGVSGSDSSVPGSPLPSVEDVDGKNVSFSPVSWPSVEPHHWVLCHCVLYLPLPLHTAVGSVLYLPLPLHTAVGSVLYLPLPLHTAVGSVLYLPLPLHTAVGSVLYLPLPLHTAVGSVIYLPLPLHTAVGSVIYVPLPLHTAVGSVSLRRLLPIAFAHRSGFCVTVSSTCHYLVHIAVFFVVTVPSAVSSSYHCYVHWKIVLLSLCDLLSFTLCT